MRYRAKSSVVASILTLTGVVGLYILLRWSATQDHRGLQTEAEALAYARVARARLTRLLGSGEESSFVREYELDALLSDLAAVERVEWVEIFDDDLNLVASSDGERRGRNPTEEHLSYARRALETRKIVRAQLPRLEQFLVFFTVSGALDDSTKPAIVGIGMRTHEVESEVEHRTLTWFLAMAMLAVVVSGSFLAGRRRLAVTSMRSAANDAPAGENGLRGAVAHAEARYQSLIEAVPHGVSKVDVKGRIVYCNQANARIYGYEPHEMVGRAVWDLLVSETDREASRNDWPRIVGDQPTPTTFHGKAHTRDGREIDIEVDWSYEHDKNGTLTGLICVVTDVTDQVRANAQLLESEERYRLLVEASPYGISEIDRQGNLLSVNRAGAEMFRADASKLVGAPYLDLVCDENRERVRAAFETSEGGSPQELEFCLGDGRFVHTSFVPVHDGADEVARLMSISMDVTETKRAREALKRSEARFREIVHEMPVMMDACDDEGRIVVWNRECERVTGYGADEIVENPDAMKLLYPDGEGRSRPFRKWPARGKDYRDWEWELRCKEGRTRIVSWSNVSGQVPIPGWSSWEIGVDVTERRRAERALEESEATLRSITESFPDVLLVCELDGTIRFLNRTLERTKEDVVGTTVFDYLHEPFRARLRACFDRVVETRRLDSVDTEYQIEDGRLLFFETRLSPMFENDEVSAVVIAASDITKRREAEARFRAQYEHSPVPIFTWKRADDDFVLVNANAAGFAQTDGRVAQNMGKLASVLYRDDPEILRMFAECYRTKAPVTRELRHRFLTTKGVRDVEATLAFVPPDLVMVHAYDITERKAAQEALERSEASLARAQRIAHVGNWDWLVPSNEVLWSDETYRIFGLEPKAFRPSYETFLETVHAADRDRVADAVEATLAGRAPYSLDFRIIRRDGEDRVAHAQGEVILDELGRPFRMVGTIQDVTDQRTAEKRLASALEEKETLLREVHHRVKNNLQIVSSLLELQGRRCNDEAITNMLAGMESRVQTMALIHENLYQSTDLNRVDFPSYVRSLASALLSAHRGFAVNIETDVEDASLPIETAVPCGLIVNELVTNAVRHAFRERAGTVRVGFRKDQNDGVLSIEDDGIGLPEDIGVDKASSLGLRLVSRLAEQIQGRIDVERRNGTKFEIRFSV